MCSSALAVLAIVFSTAQAANRIHVESVQASPGEQDLLVRILVDNDAPLWALSFAARRPAGLTLQETTLEGTAFGPGGLAAEYFHVLEGPDYFGAAVLIAVKEGGLKPQMKLPFGPFLALAALIYLFFGEKLIDWYLAWPG